MQLTLSYAKAMGTSDRTARVLVWGTWLAMLAAAFWVMYATGHNIPLAEDWLMVAPLTGKEPNLADWLWRQVNEHRIPVPRLILLLLLQSTGGDFRVGGFFNVVLLGLLAFVAILAVRRLRGGRTRVADAFFPLILLHTGHSANLLMGWQVVFVFPTVLTCAVILAFTGARNWFDSWPKTLFLGISVVIMPLCGANGLLFVPFLAGWFTYWGVRQWRTAPPRSTPRRTSAFLVGAAGVAVALSALYFVGYEHPWWNPPSPGITATLKTAAKLAAMGFGPVASRSWPVSIAVALGILLTSLAVAAYGVLRTKGTERQRALGVFLLFGNVLVFALAVGYGRAGWVPTIGLPSRYVLLTVPALFASFFIWELYGPARLRKVFHGGLFLTALVLLPFNARVGRTHFGDWYQQGAVAVERDIAAGVSQTEVATRHQQFLIHWWKPQELEQHIQLLREAGIEPFARLKAPRTTNANAQQTAGR